jgi:general secretion pathway protein C
MVKRHYNGLVIQRGDIQPLFVIKGLIAALLLLWLAHSSLQLVNMLLSVSVPPPLLLEPQPVETASNNGVPPIDIASLKAIPLFGEVVVVQQIATVEPKEEAIVETKLNLVLKGLFTSDRQGFGQAIVANGNREELYQVGSSIEGLTEVTLLEVFADRVKLSNRGNVEVLYLYPEGERLSSSASVSAFLESGEDIVVDSNNPEPTNDALPTDDVLPANNIESPTSKPVPPATRLNDIMRVVRERSKDNSKEMLGFRVLPGRDREGFERSGLQVNDIITSLDGEKLTDLRSAMDLYRNKRDATRVSLLINRDGSELSLDIDLNALK